MVVPQLNPVSSVPFRKDHLENCLQSVLSTRSDKPIDFTADSVQLPDLDDSDVQLAGNYNHDFFCPTFFHIIIESKAMIPEVNVETLD